MPAEKKTAAKKTSVKKTPAKKTAAKKTAKKKQLETLEPELIPAKEEGAPELAALPAIEDPIGDETDGEAAISISEDAEVAAHAEAESEPDADADAQAQEELDADAGAIAGEDDEAEARPPVKLERLQKIMAQAGVASRRAAEGMITEGRVQVNGTVVTELGTKADAGRDHIRVDGKLLHGAERHRYFVLNKPKGFVTTVKDPEGRPTVMQFFEKMRERLYPVGRLAAGDQRRRAGESADTCGGGRGEDLPGEGGGGTYGGGTGQAARRFVDRQGKAWRGTRADGAGAGSTGEAGGQPVVRSGAG
jgi:hypothetical protein